MESVVKDSNESTTCGPIASNKRQPDSSDSYCKLSSRHCAIGCSCFTKSEMPCFDVSISDWTKTTGFWHRVLSVNIRSGVKSTETHPQSKGMRNMIL